MNGVVIKSTGSKYQVLTDDGKTIEAVVRGTFRLKDIKNTNPIAVGDRVSVEAGAISEIFERKNYIIRRATNLSKQTHIIAANIDQCLLVATIAHPRTSRGFIDRYLVTAEAYGIPATVLFNKVDLYSKKELFALEEWMYVYREAGYRCISTSTVTKEGIDELKEAMKDKVSLISGHSGTGKSSLTNTVEPSLHLRVGKISEAHMKGKHTTTFAEMFPLPFGGFIIDTPGIKEFGLVDMEKHELSHFFPEMRAHLNKCRFNNCLHVNEPGCSVLKALEEGEIDEKRYESYLQMLASEELNSSKFD